MRSNWAWAQTEVASPPLRVIAASSGSPGAKSFAKTANAPQKLPSIGLRRHWLDNFSRHFLLWSPFSPLHAAFPTATHQCSWGKGRAACSTEPNWTLARDVRHRFGELTSLQLVICFGAEWNSRALSEPHRLRWRGGIPAVPVEGLPTPERLWVGPDRWVHHRVRGGSHWERPGWVSSGAALQRGLSRPLRPRLQRLGYPSLALGTKRSLISGGVFYLKKKKSCLFFRNQDRALEWWFLFPAGRSGERRFLGNHLGYKCQQSGSDGDLQVDFEYGEISHPFV